MRLIERLSAAVCCCILALVAGAPPAHADTVRDRQWHLKTLNASAAQRVSDGAGVVVAVIDTGVKADHRDLTGNVLPGIDLVADSTEGWVDTDGHGTAMAGLIAGHGHGTGSADGALGIAPAAKILPIRAMRNSNRSTPDIPAAIDKAVQNGADVISMSLGVTNTAKLDHALDSALQADVVLVAATGNRPNEVFLQYPAKYPGVIAVGATGRDGKVAPFSVTGKEMVLSAPGEDIMSTSNSGNYRTASGTSDSTAIVAGAAALVRAEFPGLSAREVVRRLTATATDLGAPGRDSDYGFGELNLVAALTADVPASSVQPSAGATASGAGASAAGVAVGGSAVRVDWVALVVVALLVVVGVALVVWLVVRSRRRRGVLPGFSGGGSWRPPDQRGGERYRDP